MRRGGGGRAAVLAAAAGLWPALLPVLTFAQNQPGQVATEAPVRFDIPSQPMARALNSWAVQANAQLFVDPGPVARLIAPAVKGTLPPRQALRALLAHSNLEVSQGTDGVFVIKPRPLVAAAPKAPAPVIPAPAAVPAVMAAPSLRAPDRADEGPWSLRFDATYLDDSGSDRSGGSAALGGEFRFNDHLALAVSLTVPRTHSFEVQPSQNAAASRAGARLQTSALGIRYFLLPGKPLQPYLGAGIGITMVSDVSAAPGLDRTAVGPWVQGGLDYPLAPHWLLNADVSWVQVHPGSSAGSTVHIDPVQLGIGVVYRFGPSGP